MAEDILPTKDRSPRSPSFSLSDAIEAIRKLHQQARSTTVSPESAARALGYASLNGSALSAIATLGQYGLVTRDKGNVAVSPLAIKILHPMSTIQKDQAIREAALGPPVFTGLLKDFGGCSVDVISSKLIQSGFTPTRARRVAGIYTDNTAFAKLGEGDYDDGTEALLEEDGVPPSVPASVSHAAQTTIVASKAPEVTIAPSLISGKMLAQYTIPLGENLATLVFTGQKLTSDDFDALKDFVDYSKRQFERAQKSGQLEKQPAETDGGRSNEGQGGALPD